MARYTGPVTKLSRREGVNLFLKGDRCGTEKDSFERKPYPPGQHGQSRQKLSEYAVQLREKQKMKRIYGLLERQFRKLFHEAERIKGVTGDNLVVLLESRLDNIVYRAGFARTRAEARIWVTHGHFLVNGKRMTIPSSFVKAGDVVSVCEKSRTNVHIQAALQGAQRRGAAEWIETNPNTFEATIKALPQRSQITVPPLNEHYVVELYSK